MTAPYEQTSMDTPNLFHKLNHFLGFVSHLLSATERALLKHLQSAAIFDSVDEAARAAAEQIRHGAEEPAAEPARAAAEQIRHGAEEPARAAAEEAAEEAARACLEKLESVVLMVSARIQQAFTANSFPPCDSCQSSSTAFDGFVAGYNRVGDTSDS
jgi:hypothetical protein